MEKINKVICVLGVAFLLCGMGIVNVSKVYAETDFEIQQKTAELEREAQKQDAEQISDEQQRENQKQAAENKFEAQNKNVEQLNESKKQGDEQGNKAGEKNEDNQINADQHRSAVSTFVQGLLNVADRENDGIGEKVRVIAKEQNDSKEDVAEAIEKVQNRSNWKIFLIGTDYKNIGQLRSEIVKTENQMERLKEILTETTDEVTKASIQEQITALEKNQQKINDFVKTNESKFSLFGWFVKMFNK